MKTYYITRGNSDPGGKSRVFLRHIRMIMFYILTELWKCCISTRTVPFIFIMRKNSG